MSIIMIAAVDQNGAIGRDNQLLAHTPDDMAFFRKVTTGNLVIMGRKTYDSLPPNKEGRRFLPNRVNLVLSRDEQSIFKPPVMTLRTVDEALSWADTYGRMFNHKDAYIIGGGEIYKQFMPHADKLYVTHIEHAFDRADAFFPKIDDSVWGCINAEIHFASERNKYGFTICTYERITDIEKRYKEESNHGKN